MSPITDHPAIAYAGGGRWWLTDDLTYTHPTFGEIVVPEGTETDLDSVPRLPFAYWLTKNASVTAAIIHDWLYQQGKIGDRPITRGDADGIMLDIMEDEGVSWWQRRMIWFGLRIGGWLAWNKHRAKDDQEPGFI